MSVLASSICNSGILRISTSIGSQPLNRIAALRTVPPCSLQYGGVSDQPPPQFTRTGRFISGAGGGGFLQVVLKKGVTQEMLHKRLRDVFQDSGVDVWDVEFV